MITKEDILSYFDENEFEYPVMFFRVRHLRLFHAPDVH